MSAPIHGRKGGKSGGGGGSTEAPDDLFSDATWYFTDVVSEGPIEGWADPDNPARCILFDGVPLQLEDGSYTAEGVEFWLRTGEQDQQPAPGFSAIESEQQVGAVVRQAQPVSRTITEQDLDALRVTVQLPALNRVEGGDLVGAEVEYVIETQIGAADWELAASRLVAGKSSSGVQQATRIELPPARPVTVRVRRVTPDSEGASVTDDLYFGSYTEIIDAKLSYPGAACVDIAIPADAFGGRLPVRTYLLDGVKMLAPSNYDPATGLYDEASPWDGTLKTVYHTNPAWALYSLIVEGRWGLGDRVDPSELDKVSFYEIGKYCDELVDDGAGGLERRFTINGPMKDRSKAHDRLLEISNLFRGLTYWGAGAVVPTSDRPSDPVMLVSNSSVVEGRFLYSSTARVARKNSAIAFYRVPDQNYALMQYASYDDAAAIAQHGLNETTLKLPYTTSRGEAERALRWLIETDNTQRETVSYVAGPDHAAIRPGDVVLISDANRIGWRASGRVRAVAAAEVEIDAPVTLDEDLAYALMITRSDGAGYETLPLQVGLSGALSTLPLDAPHGSALLKSGAVWALTVEGATPKQFRVLINQPEGLKFNITAVENDPDKFARVEQGLRIDTDPPYLMAPTGPLPAPAAIVGAELLYMDGTAAKSAIDISVEPTPDPRIAGCEIAYRLPSSLAWASLGRGLGLTGRIANTEAGEYGLRARVYDAAGRASAWTAITFSALSLLEPPETPASFSAGIRDGQITFQWRDGGELDLSHAELRHSGFSSATWAAAQKVADIPKPATSIVVPALAGRWFLKTVDAQGVKSVDAAQVVIDPGHFGPINVVETLGAGGADGWVGAMSKCALINGALEITPGGLLEDWPPLSAGGYLRTLGASTPVVAYYYFADALDLGAVYTSRLSASLDVSGYDYRWKLHRLPPLSERWLLSPPEPEEWSARLELRTSDDGASWSDWAPLEAADYLARAYEFRLRLEAAHVDVTPRVARAEIVIDMPDRIAQGGDVAASAGGASIAYAPAFRAKPALAVTPQDLATGDYFELRQQTAAGFEIEFFNASGVSVARSFDWIARGYGAVI